jgi:CMP/dCMP kinase
MNSARILPGMSSNHPFQIAIDGPVAAGKGTVSAGLATRLGFAYIDTGAMYRVAALLALRSHISFEDEETVVKEVAAHTIEIRPPNASEQDGRLTTILLDGEDVSREIRAESIGVGASKVAVLPSLRVQLVKKQQAIALKQDVVMEGRDIALRVLPNAQLKIYLDAALATRVDRKMEALERVGQSLPRAEVERNIVDRDTREMTREVDPLKPVKDAWILDTTNLNADEVIDLIVERVEHLRKR